MTSFLYSPNGQAEPVDRWQALVCAAYMLDGRDLPLLDIVEHVCAEFPGGPSPERSAPPEEFAAYAVGRFVAQLRSELPAWCEEQVAKNKRATIERLIAASDKVA
jgi:hypothetical protein